MTSFGNSLNHLPLASMDDDLSSVLLTEGQIAERVAELGRRISADYAGRDLVLIGVLKGSLIFLSDLTRRVTIPHSIDLVGAQSYMSGASTAERVDVTKDIDLDLRGRHALLIEDIYDTGGTMRVILDMLRMHQPATLEVCSLLSKKKRDREGVDLKYVGFEIEDVFVVGYGLDYKERYRNLPHIGVLSPEIYT